MNIKYPFGDIIEEFNILFSKALFKEAKEKLKLLDINDLTEIDQTKVTAYLGISEYSLGQYEKSEITLNRALEKLNEKIDPHLFFYVKIFKSATLIRTSRIEEGILKLESVVTQSSKYKFQDLLSLANNWIGNGYWLSGRLGDALKYHNISLQINRNRNDNVNISRSLNNIGIIYRTQGKLKESIEILNEAIDLNFENAETLAYLYNNRGIAYFELGEFSKSLQDQFMAYEMRVKTGANFLVADSLFNTIRIASNLKDKSLLETTFNKFDSLPEKTKSINTLKEMAKAFIIFDESPDEAYFLWEKSLANESLEFGYKLICFEELIKIAIDNWIQNKGKLEKVNSYIESYEKLAYKNNISASLVKIHIVRSMIFKNIFEFEKAEACLTYAVELSSDTGLPYHKKLANDELKVIQNEKNRFHKMYEESKDHSSKASMKNELNEILVYVKSLQQVLSTKYEQKS